MLRYVLFPSLFPWILAVGTVPCVTGEDLPQQIPRPIAEAQLMIEQGRSLDALTVLMPQVQQDCPLDEAGRGIAWDIIGSAYRSLDRYDEARRSFQTSAQILSTLPSQRDQTAATLNNLGGVEEATGNLDDAKNLRIKARRLYQETGNYAGVALTSNNLANLALVQHDLSGARKWEREAFDEAAIPSRSMPAI